MAQMPEAIILRKTEETKTEVTYCMADVKTNADRIRSMTDEELAELWWERVDCGECPIHKECKLTEQDCKRLALDWLQQEGE